MPMSVKKQAQLDVKAFEILVRQHHRQLCAYGLSLVNRPDVVEDLVQEAFITAYKKLESFDVTKDFGKWMRGMLRFKCLEWARKQKELVVDDDVLEAIAEHYSAIERVSQERQDIVFEILRGCMGELKGAARGVIELFYFKSQSCIRIAEALKSSETAVRQRLRRTRQILAECVFRQIKAHDSE